MQELMRRYIQIVDALNYRIGRIVMYDFALVVRLKDVFRPLALDAGNGPIRIGRLLHAGRTILDPDGLERAHGPAVRRLEPATQSMV